jgi:hypothetical protein
MKKPPHATFERFVSLFDQIARRLPRPIRLAPYLVIGHPGETAEDVIRMRDKLVRLGLAGQSDVQIFTPSPGSLATAMYCSETDEQGRPIAVEKSIAELIRRQRFLIGERDSNGQKKSSGKSGKKSARRHGPHTRR